jgi:hypothetical protein
MVGDLAKRVFEAFGGLSPAESGGVWPPMEGKRDLGTPPHTPPAPAYCVSLNFQRAGKTYRRESHDVKVELTLDTQELVRHITQEVIKAITPLLVKSKGEEDTLFTVKTLARYLGVSDQRRVELLLERFPGEPRVMQHRSRASAR